MEQTYDEFEKEFLDEIKINAQIDGTTPDDYFLKDILGRLSSMGEIIDPQIAQMQKRCRNQKIMSFDAYAFDESDKSVILIKNDFVDDINVVLNKSQIEQHKQRMLNFLQEAYDDKLSQYFDMTDVLLFIGKDIGKRMKIDYVDLNQDTSIDKIKLIIVTNKRLSERIKTLPSENFNDKKVEINVWSLIRLYDLYKSGREKETIIIETNKFNLDGIPCIKAEMSGNLDYDAYLAIVPGNFLHQIYYEHGSRLLEGNVRAFLSNRGKINKGIRTTIREEPTKFFTYNNGIACTASKITLSSDGHKITAMEDLQIINGGQTTASLTSAVLKDKMSLNNIFVPMKLTVIKSDDYDTMIQNISKYANSQNKIKDSDLFSNHPFHRKFEELAKRIQAPAHGDFVHNTMWYYERSRGKYEQEQFKFTKKSERDNFVKKFPKNQVIKKEELSKYFTCAELLRPDQVSKGSEKCMSFFAEAIDDRYQKSDKFVTDQFFKNCICYAILFKTTDKMVQKSNWFISETYTKSGVVAYTISKLIYSIPKGKCLDYDKIWKKQELYPSLNAELERLAHKTFDYVQSLGGNGMEQFKKEETWKKYKDINFHFSTQFLKDLLDKEWIESEHRHGIDDQTKEEKINIELEIYKLAFKDNGKYWENLRNEGIKRHLLTPMELDLLKLALEISITGKIPTPKQAKYIWKIRKKLEDAGILV